MDSTDLARLAYLVLLGVAITGYFIAQHRGNLSKLAQQAMVWGLIFVGVIAGYGLWGDIQHQLRPKQAVLDNGQIELPRMFDGHFYLTAQLNGKPVHFVIDTGASDVVLTREDAARIGINPARLAFNGVADTANGSVRTASARVADFAVGGRVDHNVRVSVNEGQMPESLLGMSYLRRFSKIEIAGDKLVLTR